MMIEYSQHSITNRFVLVCLLIIVCTLVFIAYMPALLARAEFYDDQRYLRENPLVQNPSWASTRRFFTEVLEPSTVRGYYQPLTMISLMIDYALGGRPDNLRPFHRTSLILHVANTGSVIVLLYLLFGHVWPAAGVGLLFGLHPIAVDSVCWVSERKTVLATFFALWSLILYIRFCYRVDYKSYFGCLLMYILSLLSKPVVTPLPLMMLLMDFWPLRRLTWKGVLEKLPLFVIGVAFSVITFISQSKTARVILPGQSHPAFIPLTLCHNIVFYMYNLVWPTNLSAHYESPTYRMVLAGIIGTWILVPVLFVSLRRTRALLTGWLIFFVAILPTMGIVRVTHSVAANRYAYLPLIGLLMVLAALLARVCKIASGHREIFRNVLVTSALLIVAGAETVAVRRHLHHWRDTVSLYQHMLTINPHSARLHYQLGDVLSSQGKTDEAIYHYQQALAISPYVPGAHVSLGVELAKSQDKIDKAIEHYRKALELNPSHSEAHMNLAIALSKQDKTDEAIRRFRTAVRIDPESDKAHYNLGLTLTVSGHIGEGLRHLRQAVRLNPDFLLATKELAWLLATYPDPNVRDADEALRLASSAVELTKCRDARMLDTLAAAYAERKQFELATAVAQKALHIALNAHEIEMVDQIRARLELYKQQKPYLEDPNQHSTSQIGMLQKLE